jgi:hypothetical protein
MKILTLLLLALPLAAQAPPAAGQASEAQDTQQAAQAPSRDALPAALADATTTGALDLGYRWIVSRGGDLNTYRSIVNVEEGFRVFGLNFLVNPTPNRWVDRIDINASNWGDPYNTLRLGVQKSGAYRFTWNYLNVNYFNFLPSFADPTIDIYGFYLNQRGFDTQIRNNDLYLELLPGGHIVPYFEYDRNSFGGSGTTNLVLQSNEYTFPTRYDDFTNTYRGGVRFEYSRWGLTLEAGEFNFHDAQSLPLTATFTGAPVGGTNFGNLTSPLLGQRLFLTSGDQSYAARVHGFFTRGVFNARPASWANLYAQFVFNQSKNETHFGQLATGNIVDLSTLIFYNTAAQVVNASAKAPHPAGNFGAELRPISRLRILEAISTDRLHDSSGSVVANTFLLTGQAPTLQQMTTAQRYVFTNNRQEANVLFDATSWLTLRGGWRYDWGEIQAPAALVIEDLGTEQAKRRRNSLVAGVVARAWQKVRLSADYEQAWSTSAFFRTSLYNFQRGRVQARYEPFQTLTLTGNFNILNNDNPVPATYKFRSWDASASLYWTPRASRYTIMAEYARPSYSSTIQFLNPSTLTPALSIYNLQGHSGTALVDIALLPAKAGIQPRIAAGGSLWISSGTRPERFYQPLGRAMIPFGKHVQWYGEWRWYGFHETLFPVEGFRSNQLITGLRFLM